VPLPTPHVEQPLKLIGSVVIALILVKLAARAAGTIRDRLEREDLPDLAWWAEKSILYGTYLIALTTVLESLGISIWALITGLGLAGAGVAVAARKLLANIISGLYLAVERPFEVGDRIRVGDYQGEVVDIRVRCTVLRHRGRDLIVPNSILVEETVERLDAREEVDLRVRVPGPATEVRRLIDRLEEELKKAGAEHLSMEVEHLEPGEARLRIRSLGLPRERVQEVVDSILVKRPGGTDR